MLVTKKPVRRGYPKPAMAGLALALVLAVGAAILLAPKEQNSGEPQAVQPTDLVSAPGVPSHPDPQLEEVELGATLEWVAQDAPAQVKRRAGPFIVTITKQEEDELVAPVVKVSARGETVRLQGNAVSPGYSHRLSLIQNLRGGAPVLMLQSFSGGAHCCNLVQLAGFSDGKLKTLELGNWDGAEIALPEDVNGDGVADFVVSDNSFLYAFASYASSIAPPQILNVRHGKIVDVSKNPDFRRLFLETMNEAGERCTSGDSGDERNGACPGYVASAARAGKLEAAWSKMLAGYDATSGWEFPTACRVASRGECPAGEEIHPKSYPEALLYFLKSRGFIPKAWQPPEFFAPADSASPTDGDETSDPSI